MKAKTVVSLLMITALILSLVPAVALADGTYGNLTVTGGTEDTDYSYVGNSLTILTGTPLTLSGSTSTTKVIINTNVTANLTLQDASIDARSLGAAIHLYGGTTLNLTVLGNNTLRSRTNYGGIDVTSGKTLVITEASTGTLNVTGGYDSAGIGGGNGASCGNVTIWNGTIYATGNRDGAGIGGGRNGYGGTIVIRGGTVKATGGSAVDGYDGAGAGIGGGCYRSGGNITISGGYVEAKCNLWAAGIGGGWCGDGGTITIDGGTVKATGNSGGAGIGGGSSGAGGSITIKAGTVEAVSGLYGDGAGIGGGYSGNGGTVKVTGGVVFANSVEGTHDVGPGAPYEDEVLTGSLEISGTAALFLKHDTCVSPTTSTHKHINATGHTAGASVYGYPVSWSGNFGGYLFGYSLSYELNSGVVNPENPPFYGPLCDSLTLTNPTKTGYIFDGWAGTDIAGLSGSVTITPDLTGDRAYTANWTPNTYTVNYNANGGTGITAASSHIYDVEKALTVNGFTKAHYTFAGWATDASGAVVYGNAQNVSNLMAENGGTVTLYAKWVPYTYTVNYNANGGTGVTESSSHAYDEAKALTVNGFTRAGYTFAGWAPDADGAAVYGNAENVSNLTAENGGTVTLFAKWTPNTYTVSYDANGGAGATEASSHTYDEAKALTDSGFTRIGYTFAGWATSTDGAAAYGNAESVSNLTAENGGTVTLFAKWVPYTYAVNYNANGGAGATEASSHTYDEAKALTDNGFTRTGYTFAGWATIADGAAVYGNAASVSNLTAENGGTVTLFVKWVPNNYTVNYNANGGTGTTESSSHIYDEAKALTDNGFTRTGYTFAGWAADADSAAVYGNAQSVINLTTENVGTVTLHAKWVPNTYTVSYNANGGKGTTETSSHIYGETKPLSSNGFTRKGYTFAGWATGAGGAAVYYNGQSVKDLTAVDSDTVTLYAVWIEDDEPASDSLGTVENCISGVNVRSGPGTSYSILGVAPKGAKYTIIGQTGAWFKVNFGGIEGYISARYISLAVQASQPASPTAEQGTVVNCKHNVNIRSGPGTGYSILGFASKGAAYTITGQSGAWYKINFGGKVGYISADYFSASAVLPASPAAESGQGTIVNCNHSINVRSGPGTEYSILGFAPKGAVYTIIEKSGAWFKIDFNGTPAYISASYFSAGNE